LLVLYALLAFGALALRHVLVAIRENEQRARFLGYDTNRYKLAGLRARGHHDRAGRFAPGVQPPLAAADRPPSPSPASCWRWW
jgi:hypothetical protein